MIAAWILYSILAGALIAAGALALAAAARFASLPTRWIWTVALGATVALAASAPLRARAASRVELPMPTATSIAMVAPTKKSDGLTDRLAVVATTVSRGMVGGLASVAAALEGRPAGWLTAAWIALSTIALSLILAVHTRFGRLRRRWPLAELAGSSVRVAPDVGPAVIGVARPEIVVPVWLLERTEREQALVVAHEAEHVRGRDPVLLGIAWLLVALVPWNLAAWWMLSRLRLAVELDCDARVLRRGVAPRAYGSLLIDLAGRCSGFPVGAPALADTPSHLERRLVAMRPDRPRFPLVRAAGAAALALVAVLAACETKMPTAADVTEMDASKAEQVARQLQLQKATLEKNQVTKVKYFVDDKPATAEQARAITPDHISTMNIAKSQSLDGYSVISIHTKPEIVLKGTFTVQDTTRARLLMKEASESRGTARTELHDTVAVSTRTMNVVMTPSRTKPLIYIDGVLATEADMAKLDRSQIAAIDVLKGPTASAIYNNPAAANGVIKITTAKAAKK